jgi:uncharacterized protein (TIGR03437 family)
MRIVNGASFAAGQPLAPGSFATIFGNKLCSQQAVATPPFPTSLGGCSVTVNGVAALMQYVSPDQMNFVVPAGMEAGVASVVVSTGVGQLTGSMRIGQAGPGIFAVNGMGIGEGAMLHGTMWQRGPFSAMTGGQPTPVSIFVTGLDLSTKPAVAVGGIPVEVLWFGDAPGYPGLQQINIILPPSMAGVGRVPITVTSGGQTSNVTFVNILPTTAMMQGMPGWGPGMVIRENMRRGHEASYLAFNPASNTVLVADEEDDAIRVISLASKSTVATITLPDGAEAHAIAVNETGTLAAVALSAKASIALIDLNRNTVASVIGTGYFPSRLTFSGASLLVTNAASGTVSVIDTASRTVTHTIPVGFGPYGIAAGAGVAVVANMQGGTLSMIRLSDYSVVEIPLPAGTRPHEVALAPALRKAVITTPMSNGFLILNLDDRTVTAVETGIWNAMGPGAVVTDNRLAYIANQMTASITVADLNTAQVVQTFPVDPGPRALAVNPAKHQLLVLSQATGALAIVDLAGYNIVDRINAVETSKQGRWILPVVFSINPTSGQAGSPPFTLTITGANLQFVKDLEFHLLGGMMGGGMMGGGPGGEDPYIKVSNVQIDAAGTRLTATVQVLAAAVAGPRVIRLETDRGEIMGPMFNTVFTVTR